MQQLLNLILVINSIMVVFNLIRKKMFHSFMIMKKKISPTDVLWTRTRLFWAGFESLVIFLHPLRMLVGKKHTVNNMIIASEIYYYYNDPLHIIQLYKVFIIMRSVFTNSYFSSNRAYRVW